MLQGNNLIRAEAKKAGIRLWQIAEHLQITDFQFSRKLRHELSEHEKETIMEIIENMKRGDVENGAET